MNKQEQELEKMVEEMESTKPHIPPLFELYTTLFSIAVAIMLFVYPYAYSDDMTIIPQAYWAFCFFVACMLKAVGLLVGWDWLRVIGLIGSAVLYAGLTFLYALSFPNLETVVFGCMAVFALVSIPFVRHTSIRNKE